MTELQLVVNGRERTVAVTEPEVPLAEVLAAMQMRGDRIAVELNGELAPRTRWAETTVRSGDRLEIVHFVGGGRP